MRRLTTILGIALSAGIFSATAYAAPIEPTGSFFGELTGFGDDPFTGDGIPTDQTMITTFDGIGGDVVTLALAATPRFANPDLTNDGAGTYTAQAGENDGTPGSTAGVLGATWNFSFFVGITGQGQSTIADYNISLLYDLDPGVDTDAAVLGVLNLSAFSLTDPLLARSLGGSQNANFGFLGVDAAPFIAAPAFTDFDPFAAGEYSFALTGSVPGAGQQIAAINVNVVPAPTTLALLGIGFAGFARRRRATS